MYTIHWDFPLNSNKLPIFLLLKQKNDPFQENIQLPKIP